MSLAGNLSSPRKRPLNTWFVDSVLGSDSNTGRSPSKAFASLERLKQGLQVKQNVRLAKGSFWRGELILDRVRVSTYGSGPRPILDGSDVAPNAAFVQDSGIYRIAWTHFFGGDGKTLHRVWEDGYRLERASNLLECQETPGSFYAFIPSEGGPDDIWIHASDSSDVRSNGKVYEIGARRFCLKLSNCDVSGIHTRRNTHADGSLVLFRGSAKDCLMEDGRIHCGLINGTAEDCTAWKIEPASEIGGATMIVVYGTIGQGFEDMEDHPNATLIRCQCLAETGVFGPTGAQNQHVTIGFFGHTNGPERFGHIEAKDCYVENCLTAYGFQHGATCTLDNCSSFEGRFGVAVYVDDRLEIKGGEYRTNGLNGGLAVYNSDFEVPNNILIDGAYWEDLGAGGAFPVWINILGTKVEVLRSTLLFDSGGIIWLQAGSFVFRENIVSGDNWTLRVNAGVQYEAGLNNYFMPGREPSFQIFTQGLPPENYTGLPAWRAATGQDLDSVSEDPFPGGQGLADSATVGLWVLTT